MSSAYTRIDYADVQELLDRDGQLIEVLPTSDWEQLHLPSAISIPLKKLDGETASELDRDRPVITYCYDRLCDLSARAAHRLADLGFPEVYDYAASKVDWMARGLPLEGDRAQEKRALDYADAAVTCAADEPVGEVRGRVADSPYPFALVTADDGTLLGLVDEEALDGEESAKAEEVMNLAPATHRANEEVQKLRDELHERDLTEALLTDPDGRLLGVISRDRLDQA